MGVSKQTTQQLVMALYVRDIEASTAFYVRLGFYVARNEGTFVELRWDDASLFLVSTDEAPPAGFPPVGNIRILVPDVDRYWSLVQELGLSIIRPIESRDYGLRDFIVAGPDGVAIRFATILVKQ